MQSSCRIGSVRSSSTTITSTGQREGYPCNTGEPVPSTSTSTGTSTVTSPTTSPTTTTTTTTSPQNQPPADKAPNSRSKYKRKLTEARREQNRQAQRLWREKQRQRRHEEIKAQVKVQLEVLTGSSCGDGDVAATTVQRGTEMGIEMGIGRTPAGHLELESASPLYSREAGASEEVLGQWTVDAGLLGDLGRSTDGAGAVAVSGSGGVPFLIGDLPVSGELPCLTEDALSHRLSYSTGNALPGRLSYSTEPALPASPPPDATQVKLKPPESLPQLDQANEPSLPSTTSNLGDIFCPDPVLPLPVAVYYYIPPDPASPDMRYSWGVPADVETKIYTPPPPPRSSSGSISNITANTATTTSPSISALSPNFYVTPNPYTFTSNQTTFTPNQYPPSSNISPSQQQDDPSPQSSIPSLYLNHLQLTGESCFSATLSIAQSLGISRSSYINDHPSPFSTLSNAEIHTIPVDLRPTAFQLILPHPCYLDCIPFPHFRSMAVYLSSLKRLDHCSLFLDLMHDGLVCWGRHSANGLYGRSMRDGVAWSKRSWEARRWFWRKWGWIARIDVQSIDAGVGVGVDADAGVDADTGVGAGLKVNHHFHQGQDDFVDDEDGMLSGSQWWWSLRDEEDDLAFSHSTNPSVVTTGLEDSVQHTPELEELGSFLSRQGTCNVGIRSLRDVVTWN